jgi:hypothetical protein
VGGVRAEVGEGFVHSAHDMQQRACRLSRDLKHAHQSVSRRHWNYDKAGMVDQARRDWFAPRQAAQEIGGHGKVIDAGKVPDSCSGVGRPPILAEGVVVFLCRLIGELPSNRASRILLTGSNSNRNAMRAIILPPGFSR